MPPRCVFTGATGKEYEYFVYEWGAEFNSDDPGNYAFTCRSADKKHKVLYFGQTKTLQGRCCDDHHKWEAAEEMGVTHILVHRSDASEKVRCAEESDLIARYDPPLNERS